MDQHVYLITAGSRTIADYSHFRRRMLTFIDYYGPMTIITGRARDGADDMGYHFARWDYGLPYQSVFADWRTHGRKAGMLRNRQMAQMASESGCGALYCLWDQHSRGTYNMIQCAQTYGLDVWIDYCDPCPRQQFLEVLSIPECLS